MHTEKHSNKVSCIIQNNIPLCDKNWFSTGGTAHYYVEPATHADFLRAYNYAHHNNLRTFILGSGANCLISDDGFNGLVIKPMLTDITHTSNSNNEVLVTAGAGVTVANMISYCLDHNIIGLEEFSGIPGTIGGSVYINLHYFNFLLQQFLVSATILDTATCNMQNVNTAWFEFGYDYSKLHAKKHFLLDATFKLTPASDMQTAYARGRSHEIIRHRQARYPHTHTCGSFFRNFHTNEVTLINNSTGKKMIHAAYYLDAIGIKGSLQVGGAKVSHQHANMIVNTGSATSSDIINLARSMQEKVFDRFGIVLQPECQLIGFKEYPLLS